MESLIERTALLDILENKTSMEPLAERRARFVYEGMRLFADATNVSVPVSWSEQEEVFRTQYICAVEQQSQRITVSELHQKWMQRFFTPEWKFGFVYDGEEQIERNENTVFIELCEIARQGVC